MRTRGQTAQPGSVGFYMTRTALARRSPLRRRVALRCGGMKRDSLDQLWSRFIRTRDRFTCQWPGCQPTCQAEVKTRPCGRSYPTNSKGYHAAHVFGRGKQSSRVIPENGIGLCFPHHQHADHHKQSCFHPWMKQRLGEVVFETLRIRAREPLLGSHRALHREAMRLWLTNQLAGMVDV